MRPLTRALHVLVALLACACRPHPEMPVLTPDFADLRGATSAGLALRVHLHAFNPNPYPLITRAMHLRVTVAAQFLGVSDVPTAVTLASRASTPIVADLTVPWRDLPGLIVATGAMPLVPYHLDGTIDVGADAIHFSVAFAMDATIPRSAIVNAGIRSVLPFPFGG